MPVVTERDLREALNAAFTEPLPPPDEHEVEVSTPATVRVTAVCPNCKQLSLLLLTEVQPDLTIHSDGTRELKLAFKNKARLHTCGQLPLPVGRNGNGQVSLDEAIDDEGDEGEPELRQLEAGEVAEITPEVLHDLLMLVLPADDLPSIETIDGWDVATCTAVAEWASAVHLVASDHDDVEIPPKPDVLLVEPELRCEGSNHVPGCRHFPGTDVDELLPTP